MGSKISIIINKMKFVFKSLLAIFVMITIIQAQECCVQFTANKCIACPNDMHLYRANCIFNIPGCKVHQGLSCIECDPNYKLNQTLNQCIKEEVKIPDTPTTIPQAVQSKGIGLKKVEDVLLNDPKFQSMQQIIESTNPNELPDPVFIAGYYQQQGFLFNYKLYYYSTKAKQVIYEVIVSYDVIRQKTYIRSINTL